MQPPYLGRGASGALVTTLALSLCCTDVAAMQLRGRRPATSSDGAPLTTNTTMNALPPDAKEKDGWDGNDWYFDRHGNPVALGPLIRRKQQEA